jgi:hypothetical protein
MKIYCQICNELIATAELEGLSVPITGQMFKAPFPDRMPESMLQPTTWEHLRCPVCNNRPFLRDDEVMTEKGIHKIGQKKEEATATIIPLSQQIFTCEICGRKIKGNVGYASHLKACKKKKGMENG